MIRLEWVLQWNINIDIQLYTGKRSKDLHLHIPKAIKLYQPQEILKICNIGHNKLLID